MFWKLLLNLILVASVCCLRLHGEWVPLEIKTNSYLHLSNGVCKYRFIDYVRHADRQMCVPDDVYIHVPIRMNCIEQDVEDDVLILGSDKEIVELLKPIGNATTHLQPGSCVFIYFYTPTSVACTSWNERINALPKYFPKIRVAAIDALKHRTLNEKFGIVGLPTAILFHEGRPKITYHSILSIYSIGDHINTESLLVPNMNFTEPLPITPIKTRDPLLWVSWIFILCCVFNFFAKTQFWRRIVEMIERNWRESGARLEHN